MVLLRFWLFKGQIRKLVNDVQVKTVLVALLGLCRQTVIMCWSLVEIDGLRPQVEVRVRAKVRRKGAAVGAGLRRRSTTKVAGCVVGGPPGGLPGARPDRCTGVVG